jgi:hypothetical protein
MRKEFWPRLDCRLDITKIRISGRQDVAIRPAFQQLYLAKGVRQVLIPIITTFVSLLVGAALTVTAFHLWQLRRERVLTKAREMFHLRREWLEAEFLKLAGRRGVPRGLAWVDCDFDREVQFAKDRASGQLRALVGVTIRFEAIEGGGMEDVEAVGNLRAATAVFFFDGRKWTSGGRALFNLNPLEAIRHYRHELETVD